MDAVSENILGAPQANVARKQRIFDHGKLWAVLLGFSTLAGLSCAVSGLTLSLLAALSVIGSGSAVRFAVPALIVAALSLFMFAADAMDRLQAARK